ncbi:MULTISPECIES: NAD(+) diphosphatase [Sphingopyxis]|uniref:NAD(+) diphosphatase n=1 Tax=Sphingopyxis terrae subsp. ummariensis TaxID=429001 RepID=A0A1Y6FVU3_9SPHN|nr:MULTISPECIES: NAD(+) diphosphatase [Sphingopyxis]KTE78574.1 NADH pyrophosphatase [Sphingopyxis sp. A083]PCF90523.1 NADH pyrophosphatase [Sphingopyxis terrae subsp. ummariensis]SMQ77300.1 NAD+ diphosphatase [Sphingopyxis terrae subsp. ummariensis]
MPLPLGFTGARLDRADRLRTDPEAFAAAIADPRATCLLLDGIDPVPGSGGGLMWEALDPADERALLLLGIDDSGAPRFVREAHGGARVDARSRTVMRLLPMLSPEEAALYGGARSLVDWHARHRFCAVCGSPTELFRGGWGRRCASCGAEHFPRVDPVVIMLAEYEGRVLLGRQPGFPPGFFSALAGFVEPGESLEEAVARELFEEAGIAVSDVSYVASQPWPFPSSLMIGCRAVARGAALTIDTTELEAAMWVDRAEVRAALAGDMGASFMAPPPLAIARYLLEDWVA